MRIEPSTLVAVLWNCRLVHVSLFQEEIEIFGLILINTVLDFYSFGRLPVIIYNLSYIDITSLSSMS